MNNPSSLTLRERFDARALSSVTDGIAELAAAWLLLEASPERDELHKLLRGLQQLERRLVDKATKLASKVSL